MSSSLLLCILSFLYSPPEYKISLEGNAQGTTWRIDYYSHDSLIVSKKHIDSIFYVIDLSLSQYHPHSLINEFNHSRYGISVDTHFLRVIQQSLLTYYNTKGLFDITYKSKCVGSDKLIVRGDSVLKKQPCVVIDTDGIAQGYTVDVLSEFLLRKGINNFIVELGGEIRVSGTHQPSGTPMKVGIESPADNDDFSPFIQKIISLPDGAITTSGNYRRKEHIIDPLSGKPVIIEIVSVTVFAKDAMTADAYDNAILAMGLKKARRFARRNKAIAVYLIYRNKKGIFKDYSSKTFRQLFN